MLTPSITRRQDGGNSNSLDAYLLHHRKERFTLSVKDIQGIGEDSITFILDMFKEWLSAMFTEFINLQGDVSNMPK